MLDTRGSGQEYIRQQLSEFEKITDLFTNGNRCIYAELLRGDKGQLIYFREWLASHGTGDSWNFCIINSLGELKQELRKDMDHGDLAPGLVNRICDKVSSILPELIN